MTARRDRGGDPVTARMAAALARLDAVIAPFREPFEHDFSHPNLPEPFIQATARFEFLSLLERPSYRECEKLFRLARPGYVWPGKRVRGPGGQARADRDRYLVACIRRVVNPWSRRCHGLPPTTRYGLSLCDALAAAFNLDRRIVERAWKGRRIGRRKRR